MNTIEGNKLIAEFMGGKKFYFTDELDETWEGIKINNSPYPFHKLEYHSSWNWLMPVVEKIARLKLKYENEDEYYNPYPRTFAMQDYEGNMMVRFNATPLCIAPTLIEATYEAVVQFLEYYYESTVH